MKEYQLFCERVRNDEPKPKLVYSNINDAPGSREHRITEWVATCVAGSRVFTSGSVEWRSIKAGVEYGIPKRQFVT